MLNSTPGIAITGVALDLTVKQAFGRFALDSSEFIDPLGTVSSGQRVVLEAVLRALSLDGGRVQLFATLGASERFATVTGITSVNITNALNGYDAVIRGAEAIEKGHCEIAVILAVRNMGPSLLDSSASALVMEGANAARSPIFAVFSAGLLRSASSTDPTTDLLSDVCARGQVSLPEISLLDLYADTPHELGMVLDELGPITTRGRHFLPHCTVNARIPVDSSVSQVRAVAQVALSIYQRVLAASVLHTDHVIESPFCACSSERPWIEGHPRWAAIVSTAFHMEVALLFREASSGVRTIPPRANGDWDTELLMLEASSLPGLVEQLELVRRRLLASTDKPLNSLLPVPSGSGAAPFRIALLGGSHDQLIDRIGRTLPRLGSAAPSYIQTPDGTYFARRPGVREKTVFMFPGQGSQYLGMFGDLCLQMPALQTWFEQLQGSLKGFQRCPFGLLVAPPDKGLSQSDRDAVQRKLATPIGGGTTSFIASLGLHDLLASTGVQADAMVGYSNGENAALIASGTWRIADRTALFGVVDEVCRSALFDPSLDEKPRGHSIAVNNAPPTLLAELLHTFDNGLFVALDNCPAQIVLFGEELPIETALSRFESVGAVCSRLTFDRGHHTPVFDADVKRLSTMYASFEFGAGMLPLYSCAQVRRFSDSPEEIRALALSQWVTTVRFRETVELLYEDSYRTFVEVGPNSLLTSFVHNTLRGRTYSSIATNVTHRSGLEQLLRALGHLFVSGHHVNLASLRAPSGGVTAAF